MPNHLTNIIEIVDLGSASLEDVRGALLNKGNFVDFNMIVPMPKCLEDFEPHQRIISLAEAQVGAQIPGNILLADFEIKNRLYALAEKEGMSEEDLASVERAVKNYEECGHFYWYDWNCDNWDTKWNAYSQPQEGYSADSTVFMFNTAWSHPAKIIMALSKKLPTTTFDIKYADEEIGNNCGTYTIKGGVITDENIAPLWEDMTDQQQREYTALAFNIRYPGEDPRSRGYDENWKFSDEVYDAYEEEEKAAST